MNNKEHLNSTALIFTFAEHFPTVSFIKITVLFTFEFLADIFDEIFLSDGSVDQI